MAGRQPRTWLLLGDKQGDNGQVLTLAEALGWPWEVRRLEMKPQWVLGKPRFRPTLDHLDLERSDPLAPPWPDLLLTVGRRPSMAALWIKRQSRGRTRVVLVGKPTGRMGEFDLVVASAENVLPPLPNLVSITLPLMRIDPAAAAAEAARWRERLAPLPRPLVGVFVGGETNPFRMNATAARRLAASVARIRGELGGTPWVVTSRRTRPEFAARLRDLLPPGTPLWLWSPGADDNPYRALLAAADAFVVTGDSISMMVEVIRLGKPLAIHPLPVGLLGAADQLRRAAARWLFDPRSEGGRWRRHLAPWLYRLDAARLFTSTRDFAHFHRRLVEEGLAVWDGEPFRPPRRAAELEMAEAVARIRALVA
ncbi:MAG: hypothetical protein KatS3mg124_0361 [Porticoccaceae bacterium]|nr:MAG: hypothetical protein KatS3mg124_0361 [Porticoccaceae bacterium]